MRKVSIIIFIAIALILTQTMLTGQTASADQNSKVRLVVLGDRTGGHMPGLYGEMAKMSLLLKPDIVVTVGDMIEGYSEDSAAIIDEWEFIDSVVSIYNVPFRMTPGNRDIWSDLSEAIFRERYYAPYYSFDFDNYHFVILDNSCIPTEGPWPEEQLAWLEKDLQENSDAIHTLAFAHKPFWYETIAVGKPDAVHDLLVKYGVDVVFTGHYHTYFSGEYDGVRYTNVGSTGAYADAGPTGIQYHFMWVTLDKENIDIAIINRGGVTGWDDITADERRLASRIRSNGFVYTEPLRLSSDLKQLDSTFSLEIRNMSDQAVDDTLIWETPNLWTIQPKQMAIKLAPKETGIFEFAIDNQGDVYPLPGMSLTMPFSERKSFEAKKSLRIARTASASFATKPKIDGLLNEKYWDEFETTFFGYDGIPSQTDPVKFAFAYDNENLYLGAKCDEMIMDSLVANVKEHDGAIYGEDCVGYFIQPDIDSLIAYQIYFNPLGTCYDSRITVDPNGYANGDNTWNCESEVKTHIGDDFWSFEARIPFSQFGAKIEKGRTIKLNFRRKHKRLNTAADWMDIDYHPHTYGILYLK